MLLEIKNLWVRYEGAEVLKGISCSIEEGTIVTFLGSNGAGKSTTVRAICGLKAPDSGEIWFNGERIDKYRPQNIIKKGIGHVPEGRALFPYMSVLENLKVGAYLQKDRETVRRKLERDIRAFPDSGTKAEAASQDLERRRAARFGHRPRLDGQSEAAPSGRADPWAFPYDGR